MYKTLGSITVIISSTLVGFLMAGKYKKRIDQLREIRGVVQIIETEIFFTATPIIEVIEKVTKQAAPPLCEIFKEIYKLLKDRQGLSLAQIWARAFDEGKKYTAFTKEDLETIIFFGQVLGTSDGQSQVKNTKLVQNQLIKLEEGAERDFIKNEKLYRNLGILLGLTIVIILY